MLGLYYESLNQYQKALIQFIMSIHSNHKKNNKNDLIMVSHWKLPKYHHVLRSNVTHAAETMKHFLIAVDQSSHAPTMWKKYQLSELYYDFGYFLQSKMNDVLNATKYFAESVAYNIKAKEQLDQIIEENEDTFDKCTLCLGVMHD